jgi:hypothetical protein
VKNFPEIMWYINIENKIGFFSLMFFSIVNENVINDINDSSKQIVVNNERLTKLLADCLWQLTYYIISML